MTRTKILIVLSLVVVFAAGLVAGLAVRRQTGASPPDRRHRPSLTDQLDLTPVQRARMREIWSEAMQPGQDEFAQRANIYAERDEAVRALLTEDQRAEYDRVVQDADRRLTELREARRKAFEDAVARTKEILKPEQRSKYEEMLERWPGRGRRRGRGGPEGPRGPRGNHAAPPSRPSSGPPED